MTNKERILNCIVGKPIDRTPFVAYFGPWGETCERWMKEGAKDYGAWAAPEIGFDSGFTLMTAYVNHFYNPPYEYKVLSEEGEKNHLSR